MQKDGVPGNAKHRKKKPSRIKNEKRGSSSKARHNSGEREDEEEENEDEEEKKEELPRKLIRAPIRPSAPPPPEEPLFDPLPPFFDPRRDTLTGRASTAPSDNSSNNMTFLSADMAYSSSDKTKSSGPRSAIDRSPSVKNGRTNMMRSGSFRSTATGITTNDDSYDYQGQFPRRRDMAAESIYSTVNCSSIYSVPTEMVPDMLPRVPENAREDYNTYYEESCHSFVDPDTPIPATESSEGTNGPLRVLSSPEGPVAESQNSSSGSGSTIIVPALSTSKSNIDVGEKSSSSHGESATLAPAANTISVAAPEYDVYKDSPRHGSASSNDTKVKGDGTLSSSDSGESDDISRISGIRNLWGLFVGKNSKASNKYKNPFAGIGGPRKPSDEKEVGSPQGKKCTSRKQCILLMCLALVAVLAILTVIMVPIGFFVIKKHLDSQAATHSASSPSATSSSSKGVTATPTLGADVPEHAKNSILDPTTWLDTKDFNTTFTEKKVGGLPIMGLNSTWDDSNRPNEHVPPLDVPFEYGVMPIRGVNLGGWLIYEPFITPSFFEKYSEKDEVIDEWSLIGKLNQTGGMALVKKTVESHYRDWVTEDTIREIAEAGLDHIRIPYGYWAVKTYPGDQYLPNISWRYLLRAIEWARRYGLRVNVDLHSVPGGQNGWNHSGRQGKVAWLNGTDGDENGEETIAIHKQLAEFFSQDRYKNIVTLYGLVNEPRLQILDFDEVVNWTTRAYHTVREAGYEGNIIFGDGFLGYDKWIDVFPEDEFNNMTLDLHQYTIFDQGLLQMPHTGKLNFVCDQWEEVMTKSSNYSTGHGPTMVGEWSQADNDCALYLNNVGTGTRWEGTFDPGYDQDPVTTPSCPGNINCSCKESNQDPSKYSDQYRQFLRQFAELQMDVFENNGGWGSFYWTWDTEKVESTQWSYKKGRQYGLLPKLAYERNSTCSMGIPDYASMGLPETY